MSKLTQTSKEEICHTRWLSIAYTPDRDELVLGTVCQPIWKLIRSRGATQMRGQRQVVAEEREMDIKDLEYPNLKKMIEIYESKGRPESSAFLNWFLENVYRLDDVAAADAICDEQNDKGIDGIYIDHNEEQIHLFQSKVRQKASGTVGDVALKNLGRIAPRDRD